MPVGHGTRLLLLAILESYICLSQSNKNCINSEELVVNQVLLLLPSIRALCHLDHSLGPSFQVLPVLVQMHSSLHQISQPYNFLKPATELVILDVVFDIVIMLVTHALILNYSLADPLILYIVDIYQGRITQ